MTKRWDDTPQPFSESVTCFAGTRSVEDVLLVFLSGGHQSPTAVREAFEGYSRDDVAVAIDRLLDQGKIKISLEWSLSIR